MMTFEELKNRGFQERPEKIQAESLMGEEMLWATENGYVLINNEWVRNEVKEE